MELVRTSRKECTDSQVSPDVCTPEQLICGRTFVMGIAEKLPHVLAMGRLLPTAATVDKLL